MESQDQLSSQAYHNVSATRQPTEAKRARSRHAVQTPKDYANAVNEYSNLTADLSMYPGTHYKRLASFLQQPFEARPPDPICNLPIVDAEQSFKFVSIYNLNPLGRETIHINSIAEFERKSLEIMSTSTHGHLVFMRGAPSADWLLSIGARYEVDPEFFQRHLGFHSGHMDSFSLPSLPSTSSSMINLRITTIGGLQYPYDAEDDQGVLESLQLDNSHKLDEYRKNLAMDDVSRLGDSVVRDRSVHDLRHFTIEQDISIYILKTPKSWAGLIWLDNGRDLETGSTATLKDPIRADSWKLSYLPVIQHRPGIALKPRSRLLAPLGPSDRGHHEKPQSANLLHLDYGRSLDRFAAASDSFYCLQEIMYFAAFSEVQFLNMLESKLKKELSQEALVRRRNPTLSNLLYNQQVLDRHIERLRENILAIRDRELSQWPQVTLEESEQHLVKAEARSLLRNYEYLLDRALYLSERCNKGMQVVMNNANIQESQKAITQAEGVAKLTRLAFIFIPLSFTTSFFGMNFAQFGTGMLSIWVYFTVAFPIFAVSLLLMRYGVTDGYTRVVNKLKRLSFSKSEV